MESVQAASRQAARLVENNAADVPGAIRLDCATHPKDVPNQPGDPNALGASGEGKPTDKSLENDLKQYAGKNWGDLPGSLRTKIVQDLKAKYGEDYAQMIKVYFEQIADAKKK